MVGLQSLSLCSDEYEIAFLFFTYTAALTVAA